jgi:hypothetical protein
VEKQYGDKYVCLKFLLFHSAHLILFHFAISDTERVRKNYKNLFLLANIDIFPISIFILCCIL